MYKDFTPLLNILYPATCLTCKTTCFNANLLCKRCWSNITFITRAYCKKCGMPFINNNHLCTEENCINRNHIYHSIRSIIEYNDVAKNLIKRLKFYAKFEVVGLFKNWFSCILREYNYQKLDYVVPVPLHKQKLKKRGYNQTAILAKAISRIIKKPYHPKLLLKVKDTANQSDLKRVTREKNLINAFDICHKNACLIKNKNILLVDDIITTGATVNECSKTLIKNGAYKIRILSLARRYGIYH